MGCVIILKAGKNETQSAMRSQENGKKTQYTENLNTSGFGSERQDQVDYREDNKETSEACVDQRHNTGVIKCAAKRSD